jgi:NAD(P)-dependent dehydrogenase (short-subunit alcohol dehydrogenase family)
VTGSSSNIGFAIAKGPADSGALVILNGRHQDSLDRAVAALSSEVPSAMGAFVLVASEFRVVEAASADDSRATSGLSPRGVSATRCNQLSRMRLISR